MNEGTKEAPTTGTGEWKQHYRWRPQGGNTHNTSVNHMFTGALKLPVDVMYQHCDGCTHSHKSADPDTRKPGRENRGKLSGSHNLPRPHEEMRSHRRNARHLNCTVYFVDWEKVSWRYTMFMNGSSLNSSALDPSEQALQRPPWVTTTLGCFLIFTIVVDILGNLLVIFSVYRNKKLRNAGESRARAAWHRCIRIRLGIYFHTNCLRVMFWNVETEEQTTLTGRIYVAERVSISHKRARFMFGPNRVEISTPCVFSI